MEIEKRFVPIGTVYPGWIVDQTKSPGAPVWEQLFNGPIASKSSRIGQFRREFLLSPTNTIRMDKELDSLVTTQRESLRSLVSNSDALIPELLERGRAPTGHFPPMTSLGYVELDRGEEDLRPFVSQLLASLIDVVTEDDWHVGFMTYGEPISVGQLLDRLDWCVTSDPTAAKLFPDWAQQDELQRVETVCHFVAEKLQDYRLRMLEVAETEEPVPDDSGLPPYDGPIEDLRLFRALLTVNDTEVEITSINAGDIRGWLFSVLYCQGIKLTESQQVHLVEALRYSDRLCLVSQAKWIP